MNTTQMILIGGVVVAGYALFKRNGGLQGTIAITPPRPVQTKSQSDTAAVSDWLNVGAQAADLWRRVSGGQEQGVRMIPQSADDTLMANPPGNVDPYEFEMDAWGY